MYSYYDFFEQRENPQEQAIAQLQQCYQNAVRESNKYHEVATAYQLLGDFTLESQYHKSARYHQNIAKEVLLELKALKNNS
jgi:hypothetical protein